MTKSRATWTGSLSFGLVNIPVGLHTTTNSKTITFNQYDAGTTDRVRQQRKNVNEVTGEIVTDTERGIEIDGVVVKVTDEEIEAVAPEQLKTIEIEQFIDLEDIDPIYFSTSYYLVPSSPAAVRAYAMLRQAMLDSGHVGIARFVMRSRQYLCAVRPLDDALVLETMHFADEVKVASEIVDAPAEPPTERELSMATSLIETMKTDWNPAAHHDTYRQRLQEIIDTKREGGVVEIAAVAPAAAQTDDLMAALEASIAAA